MKEGLRLPQPMSEGGERLDYASSGVDIDLEGASVASLVGALSRSVRVAGTPGAPVDLPGGFGGLIEFGDNLLALATDGVVLTFTLVIGIGDAVAVAVSLTCTASTDIALFA